MASKFSPFQTTQNSPYSKGKRQSVNSVNNTVPTVQISLDKKIQGAFEQIKASNKKKTILNMNRTRRSSVQLSSCRAETTLVENDLVLKYIDHNYRKYNIRNPLQEEQDFFGSISRTETSRIEGLSEFKDSKELETPSHQTALTSPKRVKRKISLNYKKIIDMKNQASHDTDLINEEQSTYQDSIIHQGVHEKYGQQSSDFSRKTLANEEPRFPLPKRKLFVKTKPSFETNHKSSNSELISPFNLNLTHNNRSPKATLKLESQFSQQFMGDKQTSLPVNQRYRFCLMCEECLLDVNIKDHEKKCRELQKGYEMSLEELHRYVCQKISNTKVQIEKGRLMSLGNKQMMRMQNSISKWLNTVENTTAQKVENKQRYAALQRQVQDNFLNDMELIQKLNWFVRLRDNISKHMKV